jgi:hypothetical protein
VVAAPGLEVGKVGGVGPQRCGRVGGVLVGLGFRQGQGGARGRRLGAVQAGELTLARGGVSAGT